MAWAHSDRTNGTTIDAAHINVLHDDDLLWGGDVDAGTYKLTNLGTPTNNADAATKAYVDGLAGGRITTTMIEEEFTGSTSSSITLSQTPNATYFAFQLFKNGQKLRAGSGKDFTRTGTGITLLAARTTDDIFEAIYHY